MISMSSHSDLLLDIPGPVDILCTENLTLFLNCRRKHAKSLRPLILFTIKRPNSGRTCEFKCRVLGTFIGKMKADEGGGKDKGSQASDCRPT